MYTLLAPTISGKGRPSAIPAIDCQWGLIFKYLVSETLTELSYFSPKGLAIAFNLQIKLSLFTASYTKPHAAQRPTPMFGPFRATSPLSGGLLWYIPSLLSGTQTAVPIPSLSPSHSLSQTSLPTHFLSHSLLPLSPFPSLINPPPTNSPLQENSLAPLPPAKGPPTQTPPRRRCRHLRRRQRARKTRLEHQSRRALESGDAARGGDGAAGQILDV